MNCSKWLTRRADRPQINSLLTQQSASLVSLQIELPGPPAKRVVRSGKMSCSWNLAQGQLWPHRNRRPTAPLLQSDRGE